MRRYIFNSLYNMRDLGGYPTLDDNYTKYNKLIRSDCPTSFNKNEIEKLNKLNITQVIDLRTKEEIMRKPSAFKELRNINYHQISFSTGDIAPKKESDIPISYLEMYEDFSTIKKVLKIISSNKTGTSLFHCAVGKDRTGIISSILLKICNVQKEDILADYQISYTYLKSVIENYHKQNPKLPEWLGQSKPQYLNQAMTLLENKYKNFETYLKKCDITIQEINSIKKNILLHEKSIFN